MPKCRVCGAKNPASAAACISCGSPLYSEEAQSVSEGSVDVQPSPPAGPQPAAGPVAVVEYRLRRTRRVAGTLGLVGLLVPFLVAWLVSGRFDYSAFAVLIALAAGSAITDFLRGRRGFAVRYEFYEDVLKVDYGVFSRSVAYAEIVRVELRRPDRIVLYLRRGGLAGRIVVPGNPMIGGSTTLYDWLGTRIAVGRSEAGSAGGSGLAAGPSGLALRPAL